MSKISDDHDNPSPESVKKESATLKTDRDAEISAMDDEKIDGDNPVIELGQGQAESEVQFVSSNDSNHVTVLAPITKVGYRLALFILSIISASLVCLIILIGIKSFDVSDKITIPSTAVSDSTFSQQKEIIRALQEEKENYRDFIIQLSQMILLNLLLPILTAVLGYIFGSREGSPGKRNENAVNG